MKLIFLNITILFLTACSPSTLSLSKVHLTTQKGLTQTLTTKERLKPYEEESFIAHQPHLKVIRIYDGAGDNKTVITTYYPSGHIYQLLECKNNQAFGLYKEWYANGKIKVIAHILGGSPEIEPTGNTSWIFDGESKAYDQDGNIEASFNYENGLLEKISLLYYPSGQIKKTLPYKNNLLHGQTVHYDQEEHILEKAHYNLGEREGASTLYWDRKILASDEKYLRGKLISGLYFNRVGKLMGQVQEGFGHKVVWLEDSSYKLVAFQSGTPEGLVNLFNSKGSLIHQYQQHLGVKDGEEVLFYSNTLQPKLSLTWSNGLLHGSIKSWYPSGTVESEREISQNKKHGLFRARYENGDLMLLEEYDSDLLIKGEYFRKDSSFSCSSVASGEGTACLFDSKGILLQKTDYQGGSPIE